MKTMIRCTVVVFCFITISAHLMAQWVEADVRQFKKLNTVAAIGVNHFLGTDNGVYVSSNNCMVWSAVNNGLPKKVDESSQYVSVNELVFNGANLFAATDNGIYISVKDGEYWRDVNNGLPKKDDDSSQNISINTLVLHGTNLFAGTENGVYISTNNGSLWTAINIGLPKNISNSSRYTSVTGLVSNDSILIVGTLSGGVFRSTNNGNSWSAVNNGLPKSATDSSQYASVFNLAVLGTNIFAGIGNCVYLSKNNGSSWTIVRKDVNSLGVSGSIVLAGTNYYKYLSDITDDLWLSTDGIIWTACNTGWTGINVHVVAGCGNSLFIETTNGIFQSTNNGITWTQIKVHCDAMLITCLSGIGTNMFAGTRNGGILRSTNNGANWTSVNTGLNASWVVSFGSKDSNLFVAVASRPPYSWGGRVFRSSNNGESWTNVSIHHYNDMNTYTYAFAVSGEILIAGTSTGIFLSSTNGDSWTLVDTSFSLLYGGYVPLTSFAVIGANLFLSTGGQDGGKPIGRGVFLSTNNGANWIAVNQGIPKNSNDVTKYPDINALAISGSNLFAGTGNGVFLTTNNGTNWTQVKNGLPNGNVTSLAVSGSQIFAAYEYGDVFISTNNGIDWKKTDNSGLGEHITSLVVSGNHLFAGDAWPGGFWKRPLSEMIVPTFVDQSSSQMPERFSLSQNYPNPFNPSTVISYQLPVNSNVNLKIYDLLGREIATLVNEEQSTGWKEVQWNATANASGIYFYKIVAGTFVETKKMIVVK